MISSIYQITNKINQKSYIGFTCRKNPHIRFKRHYYDSCNNKAVGYNCLLYKAIRKYGIDNFTFEIIYQSYDKEYTLRVMEEYLIKQHNTFMPNGYNMTLGGEGCTGYKHTKEYKDSISGKNSHMYGKKVNITGLHFGGKTKKLYEFTHLNENGTIWKNHFLGMKTYADLYGYSDGCLHDVLVGRRNKHKDIIKVELITILK